MFRSIRPYILRSSINGDFIAKLIARRSFSMRIAKKAGSSGNFELEAPMISRGSKVQNSESEAIANIDCKEKLLNKEDKYVHRPVAFSIGRMTFVNVLRTNRANRYCPISYRQISTPDAKQMCFDFWLIKDKFGPLPNCHCCFSLGGKERLTVKKQRKRKKEPNQQKKNYFIEQI